MHGLDELGGMRRRFADEILLGSKLESSQFDSLNEYGDSSDTKESQKPRFVLGLEVRAQIYNAKLTYTPCNGTL